MSSDPFDLIGQIVGGQFRVDAVAGDADLSIVYRGRSLDANTAVAIKCLNLPETIPDRLARALDTAFQQAFRVHDRLARGHENIAQTLTSGEIRSPRTGAIVPYMVREWLEGESLAAELAGSKKDIRPVRPLEEVMGLLQGAFEAVSFAHEQGEVHLGLNPSNLFVAKRGDGTVTLKVLDFGLARMMNDFAPESPSESHSGCGLRLWLPGYAAPEQVDETLGSVGARTDVYTLALIAMETLAARKLPQFLEQVLNRALSAAADARQEDAGELWRQLRSAVSPRPALASIAGAGEPVPVAVGALSMPRLKLPSAPSTHTQPMSFGATASSTVDPVSIPTAPETPFPTSHAPLGALVSSTRTEAQEPIMLTPVEPNDLIEPNRVPSLVPPVLTLGAPPPPRPPGSRMLSSRRLLVFGSTAVAAAVVVLFGALAALRSHRAAASVAAATGQPVASASPSAIILPASSAPSSKGASASSDEPVPAASEPPASSDSTAAARPQASFAPAAARHALDTKKGDVGKCRHGRAWGYASATVTFANDGSVDKVALGPPLAGSPTGTCAAEALATAHVAPFGGSPGSIKYRFYVSPK